MKIMRYTYVCLALACAACMKETPEEIDEVWKEQNRLAFLEISMDESYTGIPSEGSSDSIYYKVLNEGTGTETIYYNSKVKVYYSGKLIDGTVFDSAEGPYAAAVTFSVSSLITGWTTALQHMKKGDRWEIWIPYQLAYGTTGTSDGSIPAYSTLIFEVEVVDIVEQ